MKICCKNGEKQDLLSDKEDLLKRRMGRTGLKEKDLYNNDDKAGVKKRSRDKVRMK